MPVIDVQGVGQVGAGDFLMSFLGVIILSFGFKIYDQRKVMARHASEILGSCAASSLISMLGTALMCRLAGLDPSKSMSSPPHKITPIWFAFLLFVSLHSVSLQSSSYANGTGLHLLSFP